MAKQKLSTSSPQYIRRMVRELNVQGTVNGFYASFGWPGGNERCNAARMRDSALQVHIIGSKQWRNCLPANILDCNGENIVVRQTP